MLPIGFSLLVFLTARNVAHVVRHETNRCLVLEEPALQHVPVSINGVSLCCFEGVKFSDGSLGFAYLPSSPFAKQKRASAPCNEIRAVTYTLKPDAFMALSLPQKKVERADVRQYGFIAQEVESLIPEVVSEDAQGFKAVAYSRLVPVVASAVCAALDRLDALEQRWNTGGTADHDSANTGAADRAAAPKMPGRRVLDSISEPHSHDRSGGFEPLVAAASAESIAAVGTSSTKNDAWHTDHGVGQSDCVGGRVEGCFDVDDAAATEKENNTPPIMQKTIRSATRGRGSWSKAKVTRGGDNKAAGNGIIQHHRVSTAAAGVSEEDGQCDPTQLLVENTALRGRVEVLEERLEQLENAVAAIVGSKTSTL